MSALTARAAALELRRGSGWFMLVVLGLSGTALTLVTALQADSRLSWSPSGPGIAAWLNGSTLLLGPVAAAVSSWVGGREIRLGVDEMLAVVVRPRWHRDAVSIAVLIAAVATALLIIAAVAAAAVAPTLSYGGGRWMLSAFLVLLGMSACLTIGLAIGRLMPYRWTAPLVGLAVYLLPALSYFGPGNAELSPINRLPGTDGWRLRLEVAVWAICWLLGIAVAAFVASTARHRRWSLVPAAAAVLAAAQLLAQPVQWSFGDAYTGWTEKDSAALERVCTTEAPTVCVRRVHAGLLPAVTPAAREVLALLPAGTVAVEEDPQPPPAKPLVAPGEVSMPFLADRAEPFTAELLDRRELHRQMLDGLVYPLCPQTLDGSLKATLVAYSLVTREDHPEADDQTKEVVARLRADGEASKTWMGRYLEAGRTCDSPAFADLMQR